MNNKSYKVSPWEAGLNGTRPSGSELLLNNFTFLFFLEEGNEWSKL